MARPTKRRKHQKGLTPVQFLRDLGIRPSNYARVFTQSYWNDVCRAGGDLNSLNIYGSRSPQAGNVFFVTEEIGRRTLSAEYDEFLDTLYYLDRMERFFPPLRRIADLGGGIGVVAMYLAARHSGCQATVYDHSPRQLELGRKWAAARSLSVEYVQASYQQIAAHPGSGDNDLVLFWRGLDLRIPVPGTGDNSLNLDACPRNPPCPDEDLQAALTGLARLLGPQGVGLVACQWSGWGLISLFEAIRRAGMGVDWRMSRARVEKRGGTWGITDAYISVRRGLPHLAETSREDAQAFVATCRFPNGPQDLEQSELGAFAERFRDGDVLVHAEGSGSAYGAKEVRLLRKEGMLLLEADSENGPVRGAINGLHGCTSLVMEVHRYLDEWERDSQGGIRVLTVHPRLERVLAAFRGCPLGDHARRRPRRVIGGRHWLTRWAGLDARNEPPPYQGASRRASDEDRDRR